jgi:hypothetical protein
MTKTTLGPFRIEEGEKQRLEDECKRLDLSMTTLVKLKLRKPLTLEEVPKWEPRLEG